MAAESVCYEELARGLGFFVVSGSANHRISRHWSGGTATDPLSATNWERFYHRREFWTLNTTELCIVAQSGPEEYNHTAWLFELRSIETEWNSLVENGVDSEPVNRSALEVIKEYRQKWAAWL